MDDTENKKEPFEVYSGLFLQIPDHLTGGGFKHVWKFHPEIWGRKSPILTFAYFSDGVGSTTKPLSSQCFSAWVLHRILPPFAGGVVDRLHGWREGNSLDFLGERTCTSTSDLELPRVGGFEKKMFTPICGEMIRFHLYFSKWAGEKPPTRLHLSKKWMASDGWIS